MTDETLEKKNDRYWYKSVTTINVLFVLGCNHVTLNNPNPIPNVVYIVKVMKKMREEIVHKSNKFLLFIYHEQEINLKPHEKHTSMTEALSNKKSNTQRKLHKCSYCLKRWAFVWLMPFHGLRKPHTTITTTKVIHAFCCNFNLKATTITKPTNFE